MANIRDILGDISFANQVENLDKRSGIDTPEDKYQDFYRPSEVSAPTKALKQLLSGAADAMINFPTAVGETIFNIGATSGAGSPYPVNVPESQYQKFPRVETPAPEGTVENIARMAGGLAGGIGLGQIGAVRNVLYAQPVENAVVRTVDAVFKNKGIGQSLMNEGLKIAAKVGGRAAAAGAANVVGDTAYNLAESTDEQGNIDYDKFADMTADTALFGAVIGGGVNLADKQLFKDVKRVSARLLKAGTEQNRAAVKQADVARTDLQNFEQQKAIVEQQEKVAQQEAAKAVPEELDNIEEAVGPIEEKPDPIDWTEKYKKVREQYDNEVSKAETFDDPVLEPKEATVTEQAKDFTDEVKRNWREFREPIFREMERQSPFTGQILKNETVSKRKVGSRLTSIKQFEDSYKSFAKESVLDKGKKLFGKMSDQDIFKMAVSNGDFDSARTVLANHKDGAKLLEGFDEIVDNLLPRIGREAVEIGNMSPEALRANYWTRVVKDPEAFNKDIFKKLDDSNKSEFTIKKENLERQQGRDLTPREYSRLLDDYVTEKSYLTKRSGATKQRKINKVEASMLKHYHDPVVALKNYIVDMTERNELSRLIKLKDPNYKPTPSEVAKKVQSLQQQGMQAEPAALELEAIRRLYKDQMIKDPSKIIVKQDIEREVASIRQEIDEGRYPGIDPSDTKTLENLALDRLKDDSLPNQIDLKVKHLVKTGELSPENATSYKDMMNSVFVKSKLSRPWLVKTLSDFGYASVLGNINSAVTQLKDVAPLMGRYGVTKVLKNYANSMLDSISGGTMGGIKYSLDDLGLERTLDDIYGVDPFAQKKLGQAVVDTLLAPLGLVDRFGKTTQVQSALEKFRSLSKTDAGIEKIRAEYGKVFTDDEFTQVIDALQKGEDHFGIRDMLIYEVGKIAPTSVLDKPKQYLDNPRGRILYDLQSFTIKRQDYIYNELLKDARKTGNPSRLMKYLIYTPLISYAVEEARDFGKNEKNVADKMFMMGLDSLGATQLAYTMSSARSGRDLISGLTSAVVSFPPAGAVAAGQIAYDAGQWITQNKSIDELYSLRYTPFIGPWVKPFLEYQSTPSEFRDLSREYREDFKDMGREFRDLEKEFQGQDFGF